MRGGRAARVAPPGQRWCARHKAFAAETEFTPSDFYCRTCRSQYERDRKQSKAAAALVEPAQVAQQTPVEQPTYHRPPERDAEMLAHGEDVCRQCPRAYHALDVITSGWAAMNRGEA